MFGAKKLDSFRCRSTLPLVAGVLRLATPCATDGLGIDCSGVFLEPEAKFVRSPSTGRDAELDLIHPVGLMELVELLEEDEEGVVMAAAWPAATVCLGAMLSSGT